MGIYDIIPFTSTNQKHSNKRKVSKASKNLTLIPALEGKVHSGEQKADSLVKEKMRLEADLDSMTKKSHDASGQLVIISQDLLKKER